MVQTTTIILVLLCLLGQILAAPNGTPEDRTTTHQRVKRFFGLVGLFGPNYRPPPRHRANTNYDEYGCNFVKKANSPWSTRVNKCPTGTYYWRRSGGFGPDREKCETCDGPKIPKHCQFSTIAKASASPYYAGCVQYYYQPYERYFN